MKKIQKLLVVALTLLLVFSLAACGSSSKESSGSASGDKGKSADGVQEITIKISHVVAENTPKHAGALAMKEYIEKESSGVRLRFKCIQTASYLVIKMNIRT